MTDPAQYTIGGIFALFIIQGASLIRDYFTSRKPDPSISAIKSLVEGQAALTKAMTKAMDGQAALRSEVHDLHRWHQPDESGKQSWKNPDILAALAALNASVVSLDAAVARIMVVS